jgi:hypothetical protein
MRFYADWFNHGLTSSESSYLNHMGRELICLVCAWRSPEWGQSLKSVLIVEGKMLGLDYTLKE